MKLRSGVLLAIFSLTTLACGTGHDDGSTTTEPDVDSTTATVDANTVSDLGVVTFDTSQPEDTKASTEISTPSDTNNSDTSGEAGFNTPCNSNSECSSGWCVPGPNGHVCTKACVSACPDEWSCRGVASLTDIVFLCLADTAAVCTPCAGDVNCNGGGACLTLDGRDVCASSCGSDDDCDEGFLCQADPSAARSGTFCQPATGSCDCNQNFDIGLRTCAVPNDLGTCVGVQACDADSGWGACSASPAIVEICDGVDNDCDGLIDEQIAEVGQLCEVSANGLTCPAEWVCLGSQGLLCPAPTPTEELCDLQDNDCDGLVDEGFTDEEGAWTLSTHCGFCGNDCTDRVLNGVGTCAGTPAEPGCAVESCDEGYVKVGTFQCAPPQDVSCKPCIDDADCVGGVCHQSGAERFCIAPCSALAGSCSSGFTCTTIENAGDDFCLPDNGSCSCNAGNDGVTRPCQQSNAFGTCAGTESCDPALGWVGCTARQPSAEIRDGADNECNGLIDDADTVGEACTNTVAEVGSCSGTYVCTPAGVVCQAQTPQPEVCDFVDNNCDGRADEGFRVDGTGPYVDDAHCGACNVSCDGALPNATAYCAENGGQPRCEVTECAEGYFKVNATACIPIVTGDLCARCDIDSDCINPGDLCLDIDGGRFCGRDCAAGNVYGVDEDSCPAGQTCLVQVGGAKQCVPTSGSCACLPQHHDQTRGCGVDNDDGFCFGAQTCDALTGWSECDAATPTPETCDGEDNDCNGFIDDVTGRGDACTNDNAFGECGGILDCVPGETALTCLGQQPAPETCNYIDDDCNGEVDEGFGELFASCSDGDGSCQRFGFVECAPDGSDVQCSASAGQPSDEVCDGVDNNCDGSIDEGALWSGKGSVCVVGEGICERAGVLTCDAAQPSGAAICSVAPGPKGIEVCNNLDDDCNGQTDEAQQWADKGSVCTTGTGACARVGIKLCDADSPQSATICDAEPGDPEPEVCDGIDNNCVGGIDEGWLNGGVYDQADACGNCFTDCTQIYARPNAFGTCNTSGAATCAMTCCEAGSSDNGCTGAADYFDLNAVPDDGCEFALDIQAVFVSVDDPAADDENDCGLGPVGTGFGHRPCHSIAKGIARAVQLERTQLFVAEGTYDEVVTVANGISLFGGFRTDTWEQTEGISGTVLAATASGADARSVIAQGITEPTTLAGFSIQGPSNFSTSGNSYAIWVADCTDALEIRDNQVSGGFGGPGGAGASGLDGTSGAPGTAGEASIATGEVVNSACAALAATPGNQSAGMGGQTSCGGADTNGGTGAGAVCPLDTSTQAAGSVGLAAAVGGTAGDGGDGGHDRYRTACGGFETGGLVATGSPGADGGDGDDGEAGAGCGVGAVTGTVDGNVWRGVSGTDADPGTPGGGGGGGGAGGGADHKVSCDAEDDALGGSGGGGGGGACAGTHGEGGQAGGAAFAIFVSFSAPTAALPRIHDNLVVRGSGGRGGDGGLGGAGGLGGDGANGGLTSGASAFAMGVGGRGGQGGDGGHGGGGGGGCGGAAFGIFVHNHLGTPDYPGANSFLGGGSGGAGGAGGPSLGASGSVGGAGAAGDTNL